MYVPCDCGNLTFHLRWIPPARVEAECAECGETREIGGSGGHDALSDMERREVRKEMEDDA